MKQKVDVFSGDGKEHLGLGVYIGNVTVYAFELDGELLSLSDCEVEPPSDSIIKMADCGSKLITISDNPKIILDSGKVVYGCQVWWHPIDSEN